MQLPAGFSPMRAEKPVYVGCRNVAPPSSEPWKPVTPTPSAPAGSGQTPFTSESGQSPTASNGKQAQAAKTQGTAPQARGTSSEVNWHALSPRSRAILRTIAIPISAGFSEAEVANMLGTSTSSVSSWMAELRDELERGRLLTAC
jgi:hypothetical protein